MPEPQSLRLPTISIVTATLNASQTIGILAADLLAQSDPDFQWIVVDGLSVDDTLAVLPRELEHRITLIEERDFGIYDALNKGIRRCTSEYYLVVGADDRLDSGAIAQFKNLAANSGADIVAASVRDNGQVAVPGRGKAWLRGQNAYLSHHSVGTLIRRNLHDQFGYYSKSFPIAADQLFIKRAIQGKAELLCVPSFISGEFSRNGVSSVQYASTLFEFTLVQMRTESNRALQLLIFIGRLLRHWGKLSR